MSVHPAVYRELAELLAERATVEEEPAWNG